MVGGLHSVPKASLFLGAVLVILGKEARPFGSGKPKGEKTGDWRTPPGAEGACEARRAVSIPGAMRMQQFGSGSINQ